MANEKQFPEESGLEHNIIKSLLEKYEATEETTYLASSEELITSSREKLSRETMDEIFKIRSKYYSQLKIITTPTPIGHEVVYISPQTARDMLKFSRRGAINKGLSNRRVLPSSVKSYTQQMNDRRWCLTGEPIIIGADGEIQDGHTRLSAAADSDVGFIAILIWGITDDRSFAHIDVGNNRSRAQVLEMAGVKVDAAVLSQVSMLAKAFEQTKNPYSFRGTQGTSFKPAQILDYVEQNEELALSVDFISKLAKKHRHQIQAPQATYAFAHYLIKNKISCFTGDTLSITPELYLSNVISGLGQLDTDNIEYKVRDYLQTLAGESSSYALLCRLSAIFKGWNMHIGTAVIGNKVAVRRVAKFTKDDEGNKVPLKGAGNINEAFTVPFLKKGKTPPKVRKQAQVKLI
ncbi:chromosome partitioning protein ParB [Vibrio brasiliensis]|uniref:chromosome partitioning protein ParB n=1 Tax=Vibrio brasiliensis TaxID=170652 RepID=UPI001EFD9C23|nr:chromosome partitioning protein ParB [Vibrio brasiliensis]MCG9749139.1 chromosome partitioning protein ParB [Vibrio brasiliensis]